MANPKKRLNKRRHNSRNKIDQNNKPKTTNNIKDITSKRGER